MGNAQVVVDVVVLCSVEFAFAEGVGEGEALFEEGDGTGAGEVFLCQFDAAQLVLSAHFAFAAFPRMEDVLVEQGLGFFVAAELVEQGDVFEDEVVALCHEVGQGDIVLEAFFGGTVEFLVKLVEFHEDAGIRLVEGEGEFHLLQGTLSIMLLVVVKQGEVAVHGGEGGVELLGLLPAFLRLVVLPLVVIEASEIVRCLGSLRMEGEGSAEHEDVVESVGETAAGIDSLCLGEAGFGFVGFALTALEVSDVIEREGRGGCGECGEAEHIDCLLPESCLCVVEGEFVVVIDVAMHGLHHVVEHSLF